MVDAFGGIRFELQMELLPSIKITNILRNGHFRLNVSVPGLYLIARRFLARARANSGDYRPKEVEVRLQRKCNEAGQWPATYTTWP